MKKKRIFLTALSVILAFLMSAFFCACDFGDFINPNKHEHSYINYVSDNNATCTANGTETAKCEKCNETNTREEANSKKPHIFVNYVSDNNATCKANGTETAKCENCNETDTREEANSKKEHSFTNFIPNNDATTEADGTKTAKCDYCDEKKTVTDEGSKLDSDHAHEYTETVIEPTCTEQGYTLFECECGFNYKDHFEKALGHSFTNYVENGDGSKTAKCDRCDETDTISDKPVEATEFSIHFLELGNGQAGDSILIDCGDTEVLIDAGSQQSSASTIKKYVDQYCTDGVLEYVITTHGDTDHISAFIGTSTAQGILYAYKIGTLIKFDYSNKTTAMYKNYLKAVEDVKSSGTNVYTASQCYEEKDGAKRQYYLDEAQTVSINILYNYYYYNLDKSDENNHSVVTLLTQELPDGNKHYLFTGDLEEGGESRMVDYYSNPANSKSEYDILPKVTLYKAGHHGSKTSSTEKLLEVIQPEYVAVCCVCGQPEYTKTNANTFPTQQMINNVSKWTDKIYVTSLATDFPAKDENGDYVAIKKTGVTSMNGDIRFFIKGNELELNCTNNNTILKDTDWFRDNRVWPQS